MATIAVGLEFLAPFFGSFAMRTIRNLVPILVLGALLFPSQSAWACHGRKACSLCASKARCYGGYGYYGQGYGAGYACGYGMAYGYVYPTGNSGYACNTASRDARPAQAAADGQARSETTPGRSLDEKLGDLERKLTALQNSLDAYKGEVTKQINKKAEDTRTQFLNDLNAALDARGVKKPG